MESEIYFPDPNQSEDEGLVAIGGELTTDFLLTAYSKGIFPWFNEGEPILWWSPNPRMVLCPANLKISKSLKRTIQSNRFTIKADTSFKTVITKCSKAIRRNQAGTWITKDIIKAYTKLHELGYAHSIEAYLDNQLVGGLYGIALGKVFFGESMFHDVTDASKIALVSLCKLLSDRDFHFIDVQQSTNHLRNMGAEDIPRETFLKQLEVALKFTSSVGKWKMSD